MENDKISMNISPHEPAYICSHVFKNTRPILYVSKDGGDWQLLCGGTHSDDEIPHVVGIGHLFDRDASLLEIIDLQDDWEAERANVNSVWVKRPI